MAVVVLVDTNVWVSAFLNPRGSPARIRKAWYAGRFDAVMSAPLLEELADVLARPRIVRKYGLSTKEIEQFIRLLGQGGIPVPVTGSLRECRDPDDDVVLETAVAGKAKYVVTRDDDIKRDEDLIARLSTRGVVVLSVRQFLEKLERGDL
ncbi:MAG: putative toxin-antitoxin system toxin component, PIN family [Planctomycetes bacterium]|nr:putative toxin-antitoxin system toxin component, PIN family [Planctomycetota bacterium]